MIGRKSINAAINRLRATKDKSVALVYKSYDSWPFVDGSTASSSTPDDKELFISVFDSSFNPPTLAHLSLALLEHPTPSGPSVPFEAFLLLLSITNADKKLKATDASYVQRVEMMTLFARDMQAFRPGIRVAVGVIDEPTFVGKSRVIQRTFGPASGDGGTAVRTWFGVGWDTLLRVFEPRYYGGPEGMAEQMEEFFQSGGSGITCARRGMASSEEEDRFLQQPEVKRWVEAHKVVMVDIGERASYSSTAVRDAIGRGEGIWKSMCTESIAQFVDREGLYTPST